MQQNLLKYVEGRAVHVQRGSRKVQFDTTNVLVRWPALVAARVPPAHTRAGGGCACQFIAGGAFVGVDKVVKQRTAGGSIGFGASVGLNKQQGQQPLSLNSCVRREADALASRGALTMAR